MNDLDREQKWVRVVLDHKKLESDFLYWIQYQDGSYKCILNSQKKETIYFSSNGDFQKYVFNFLTMLGLDDDPQINLQIDAKASPSIMIRVHKLKNKDQLRSVFNQIRRFFSETVF